MKNLPPDTPDWLEAAITELEERSRDQVRKGASAERAAGYFSAVEDLKDEVEVQAAKIAEKRNKMLTELRVAPRG